jgi:hypothetical protein
MAHTLTFKTIDELIPMVSIQEHFAEDWYVVFKDNTNIIVEKYDGTERRIYAVREWCRSDQCRATRME